MTDLRNTTVTTGQLTADRYPFTAVLVNAEEGVTLRVQLYDGAGRSRWLTPGAANDYEAVLALGTNQFTLIAQRNGTVLLTKNYTVVYRAEKADEDNPTVGPHPPTIVTNLDGVDSTSTQEFQLQVTATDYKGGGIYASNMTVTLDGKVLKNPTGVRTIEYALWLEKPDEGNEAVHHVTVTAWDDEGNSAFKSYDLTFIAIGEGEVIGSVTVVLDATTVGYGLEEFATVEIRQGQSAAYAVTAALEEWGFTYTYGGSMDNGFYLRSLEKPRYWRYAEPDENLWRCVERDELTIINDGIIGSKDSLGEYDFTNGSGWMYCVDGYYQGVSLGNYYPRDGETITLRYTVAWGKDVGTGAGAPGSLSRYCGLWINGEYTPLHEYTSEGVCAICGVEHDHEYEAETVTEPTCTEPGTVRCTCPGCGHSYEEEEPPLGHDFAEGVCTRCGEPDPDWTPPEPEPTPPPEPSPEPTGGDDPEDPDDPEDGEG